MQDMNVAGSSAGREDSSLLVAAITTMGSKIEALHADINRLSDKLAPLLGPASEDKSGGIPSTPVPHGSKVIIDLERNKDAIDNLRAAIDNLVERLPL